MTDFSKMTEKEMFEHDDKIFFDWLGFKKEGQKLIILNAGLGDHYVFKKVLPKIKAKYPKLVLAVCYPEVFEGDDVKIISIAQGEKMEDQEWHNIYKWMWQNNWQDSLEKAYKTKYIGG